MILWKCCPKISNVEHEFYEFHQRTREKDDFSRRAALNLKQKPIEVWKREGPKSNIRRREKNCPPILTRTSFETRSKILSVNFPRWTWKNVVADNWSSECQILMITAKIEGKNSKSQSSCKILQLLSIADKISENDTHKNDKNNTAWIGNLRQTECLEFRPNDEI